MSTAKEKLLSIEQAAELAGQPLVEVIMAVMFGELVPSAEADGVYQLAPAEVSRCFGLGWLTSERIEVLFAPATTKAQAAALLARCADAHELAQGPSGRFWSATLAGHERTHELIQLRGRVEVIWARCVQVQDRMNA